MTNPTSPLALPASYFEYRFRRPGMDHDRYAYSNLFQRQPVRWPNGARIALWIVPTLEHFPLGCWFDHRPLRRSGRPGEREQQTCAGHASAATLVLTAAAS